MEYFRLYDNKEKTYINSMNYICKEQAEDDKDSYLADGNYLDEPHTVIEIHEFIDRKFISKIDDSNYIPVRLRKN